MAAAFGGPAREVTTVEEASKVLGGEVSDQLLTFKRYFVVPSGIVETARTVQPGAIGAVVLRTAPTATAPVVAASAEDRARFVRQMEAAVGMTSGADPALDVQVTETVRSSGDIEVTTRPLLAGSLCESCGYAWSTSVFSSDGTLEQAVTWAQSVEDVAPVQTITASEAFDLLRHHRADALVGGGGPVVRAVLTPAVIQPGLSVPASWVFYDAEGETVGQVSAQPGRDVVMDDAAPAEVTVG